MNFWDEVGSLIQAAANRPGHQGVLDTVKIWKEERKRIEKLRFWDEVKGKHGFPQDIKVWHVHPLALVENFICKSGICFDQYFEYQTTKGVFRVSDKAFKFILTFEGYEAHPYVPMDNGQPIAASGIIIGYGYDLGQQTVTHIRNDLNGIFSVSDINSLVAVQGRKGQQAVAVLHTVSSINISRDQAYRLAIVMKRRYAQQVVDIYPEVLEFHPHCQGALLSMIVNRGNGLVDPTSSTNQPRLEMREIQQDFRNKQPENIPSRIEASGPRLWPTSNGLIRRRKGEGDLFKEGLTCSCFSN
jgi:GH24 family phage-related lysozyme (muramidase)